MKVTQEIFDICKTEVEDLLNKLESSEVINIATSDGFEIFTYDRENKNNNQNFSAMSGSIIALINSLLHDFSFPSSNLLEINVEQGHIILAPVTVMGIDIIVLAKFNHVSSKGEILYYFKEFIEKMKSY